MCCVRVHVSVLCRSVRVHVSVFCVLCESACECVVPECACECVLCVA